MINDEQLHKWVNGELSEEELIAFKLRPEYDSLVELYKNTEHLTVPEFDENKVLNNVLSTEKLTPVSRNRRFILSSWVKYGVAASVLLLAAWLFWPSSNIVEYNLANGEKLEELLPDGSSFILNADSKLTFNPSDWNKSRTLQLEGEAFFKVKKGSKFSVNTPNGAVSVLGTQFNVNARGNTLVVKCESGRVGVENKDGKSVGELEANDALHIKSDGTVENWKTAENESSNWTRGIFSFKEVALSEVLAEMERQFDVEINDQDINTNMEVVTSFTKGDINIALKTILTPFGISYEIIDNRKIILKK